MDAKFMEKVPFYMKVMRSFTYPQKFLVISCFFVLAVMASSFFLVSNYYRQIELVKDEIQVIAYHAELNKLLELVVNHAVSVHKEENFQLKSKKEIHADEVEILEAFKRVEILEKAMTFSDQEANKKIEPLLLLVNRWKNLSLQQGKEGWIDKGQAHYELIQDLFVHAEEITRSSTLVSAANLEIYSLGVLLIELLPQAERDIPQIIVLSGSEEKITREDVLKVANYSFLLGLNLEEIARNYNFIKEYNSPSLQLMNAFDEYAREMQAFTVDVNNAVLEGAEALRLNKSIPERGEKLLAITFKLWYKTRDLMEDRLKEGLSDMRKQLFLTLAITILCSLLGLALGLIIMKQISRPLSGLIVASQRLAEGDLSVRVPVVAQDEVGKVSEAFNRMVEALQELIGRLQWTGIQLTTSTTEIAAAAKQQESSIVEQEATTKQIAVTAKEISATAKDFAQTMSNISTTAEETSSLASLGREKLTLMGDIMAQMVEASRNIATKLDVLSEKAGNITSVITTIAKVADQTNLLSLNAAIEAEKAGEYGRSFSVIAKEIRRLADQTASATLDIEKMVNEIVSAIAAGVMGVDKFSEVIHSGVMEASGVGEHLTRIIEQVQQLSESFEGVNQGMQAQSLGAEQITESITQLSDTTRETTKSISHSHEAIKALNNAAQEMQASVSRIKR